MAGNYPDVPGHRFVTDRDGTQLYKMRTNGQIIQFTSGEVQTVSDEDGDYVEINPDENAGTQSLLIYFPEHRNVYGIFVSAFTLNATNIVSVDVTWSPDTTNGADGTWNSAVDDVATTSSSATTIRPFYREDITPLSLTGVKALKLTATPSWSVAFTAAHVYGEIQTGENPDRLQIWHPTLDQPIAGAYLDWGDSPRASSADRTFRIKNHSATLSADTVTCSCDALTDGSPSVAAMHLLSSDGSTFAATANIASIAPGAISGVMTLRRVLSSDAPLGLWAPRLHAAADSWS